METDKRISRREALTRMGMIVAGAAASSIGLPALTSCTEKPQKKRIILYFTATGNCLHVARQLAESEEQLLSIPQMVKQNQYEFEADEIGLVYPIYGHMPPNMVRNFIKKAKLKAAYKFAVLTYGARKCDSVEIWNDISSKAGNKFDYINTLVMVDNWLPNFDMNEQIKIDKHIPENLRQITEDLSQRRHWHEPVSEEERQMHAGFMARSGLDPEVGFLKKSENYFVVTKNCIDCGACTDVCPRG
ncbi:EFR1 family ferrodoxin, partial [Bacteroides xylanisolvens]